MFCTQHDAHLAFTDASPLVATVDLVRRFSSREVLNASCETTANNTSPLAQLISTHNVPLVERLVQLLCSYAPSDRVFAAWVLSVARASFHTPAPLIRRFVSCTRLHAYSNQSTIASCLCSVSALPRKHKRAYMAVVFGLLPPKLAGAFMSPVYQWLAVQYDADVGGAMLANGFAVTTVGGAMKLLDAIVPVFERHGGTPAAAAFFARIAAKGAVSMLAQQKVLKRLLLADCSKLVIAMLDQFPAPPCHVGATTNVLLRAVVAGDPDAAAAFAYHPFERHCTSTECTFHLLIDASLSPSADTDFHTYATALLNGQNANLFFAHLHTGCTECTFHTNPFPVRAMLHPHDNSVVALCRKLLASCQPVRLRGDHGGGLTEHLAQACAGKQVLRGIKFVVCPALGVEVVKAAIAAPNPDWNKILLFGTRHRVDSRRWTDIAPPHIQLVHLCLSMLHAGKYHISVWDVLASPATDSRADLLRAANLRCGQPGAEAARPKALAAARCMFRGLPPSIAAEVFRSLPDSPRRDMHFLKRLRWGFSPGVPAWLVPSASRTTAKLVLACLNRLPHSPLPHEMRCFIIGLATM